MASDPMHGHTWIFDVLLVDGLPNVGACPWYVGNWSVPYPMSCVHKYKAAKTYMFAVRNSLAYSGASACTNQYKKDKNVSKYSICPPKRNIYF